MITYVFATVKVRKKKISVPGKEIPKTFHRTYFFFSENQV